MTVAVTNLEAKFSIDTSDIDRGVNHVTKQFNNLSSSAQSAVSGFSFGRVFEFATGGLLANGISNVVSSIGDLGSTALDSYAYTERLESALQSLSAKELLKTGAAANMTDALAMGATKAEELSKWIEKLAVDSPFKQSEVADTFRQAMSYGFAATEAQRLTKAMLDFSAGSGNTGETMKRIGFALGQIRVNGRVASDDLNQLTDAGLDARTILADAFGVSTAALRDMISKGLVPADQAIEAITKSLENDFGGAALRQANSFSGLLSSLSDIKELGLRDFFGPMFKAAQPALQGFVEMLGSDSIKNAISSWGQSLGDFVGGAIAQASTLMSILSSSNPFAAIGESLGADVQVLGSITSVKWGDFVGVLNWNDYVVSLIWKDLIATFNWKDAVTNLSWGDFILAFDWSNWVGSMFWGDFVSIVNWWDWIYVLSWNNFITKIDLWNLTTDLIWGNFVANIDLKSKVASIVWGDFVAGVDLNLKAAIVQWKDHISYLDFSAYIPELHWSDHTVSLKWGDFIGVFNWSTWILTFVWGDYIDRINWPQFVTMLNDWGIYIPKLEWSSSLSTFTWGDFVTKINLETLTGSLVWGDFVVGVDLNLKAAIIQWGDYVGYVDFNTYIEKLTWSNFVTALTDWSNFLSKLTWTDIVVKLVEWSLWIPVLSWLGIVSVLEWNLYVADLIWSSVVPYLTWSNFVSVLSWFDYVAKTSWSNFITNLLWSDVIPGLSDWTSYISSLSWSEFIIQLLDWGTYIPAFLWNSVVSEIDWLTYVIPLAWSEFLEPLIWTSIITTIQWSEYASSLTWQDYIDALSWTSYVISLTWDSFVSKLEWPKLITGLDLRSLVPTFPGWDYFFNWFGASAPSSTAVVNNGPGVSSNTPPSSPTVSPSVTPTPPNGRSLAVLNEQQPNIVINIQATINNTQDETQLAYTVADIIKKRRY